MSDLTKHILDMHEEQSYRIHNAALWYAKRGISVIPIIKNGKKLPRSATGINYSSASHNKKIVDNWFHPDYGKFRGWNIGMPCGKEDGIFAVDLDRHGGDISDDGVRNWAKELERSGTEQPKCPVQITPNDGKHMLFKWKEGAVSSTHKIARGIDTRGGNVDYCKSHIVVFPSIVDGKMYEWDEWSEIIPEIPEWIMDKLGKSWESIPGTGRGNEFVSDDDIEEILDIKQIERMLTFIDPNECDYDKWLKVGLAIKSQYQGEEGLVIWDEWSKRGESYAIGECHIRWEGFSDMGNVRAGTLFFFSSEGGWEKEEGEKSGNVYDKLVAKMNKEFAVVVIGGKIRILREKISNFDVDMHYDLMEKDSFKTMLQNRKILVKGEQKTKVIYESDIWLGHEGRRTYQNGLSLFPEGDTPEGYFNTWKGFNVEAIEGDCSLFLSHIKDVICDGNVEDYEWLLDWFADLFQFPAHPKGVAIVMKSDEGTGKGILANTIGRMFGPHHRHLIDDSHLTSNFNAHLLDAITVFADEITWGGNKKTAGKLKGMVTEDVLVGERKGIDAILYKSMIHIMIASNGDWVIPAGPGSRRWFVLQVSEKMIGNVYYFNELMAEINNGGMEALLYFFLDRDIKRNLRTAPITNALNEQRVMSAQDDSVLHWWRKCLMAEKIGVDDIIDSESNAWPNIVYKSDLYEAYEMHVLGRRNNPVIENVFSKKMLSYGISMKRPKIKGVRVRAYVLPPVLKGIKIMNHIMPGVIKDEDD